MNVNLTTGVFSQKIDKNNLNAQNRSYLNSNMADSVSFSSKRKEENPKESFLDKIKNGFKKTTAAAALAGTIAAGGMTSCVDVDQTVDLGPVITQLENMSKQLEELMKLISDGNAKLAAQLQTLIDAYKEGNLELTDLMNKVVSLLEQNNMNDQELIGKIDTLIEMYEQGQINQDKMFAEIIKEIQNVNKTLSILADIKTAIDGVGDKVDQSNQDVIDAITKFMNEYKKGNLTMSQLMDKVVNLLGDANGISKDILAKIQELYDKYEGGGMTESELLQKILDSINDIKDITGDILEQLTQLGLKFNEFVDKYDKNQETIFEKLDNLFNGIGDVNTKLDAIKQNGDLSNDYLKQISASVDGMQISIDKVLEEIGKTNISLEEYFNYVKENDKDYEPILREMLDKLGLAVDSQITVEELKEILKDYKVNLTTTNGLLQNQINLLQALLDQGTAGVDLTEVIRLLNEINNANKNGSSSLDAKMEELNNLLTQILGNTEDIKGQLAEIITKMDKMLDNYEKAKDGVASYAEMLNNQLSSMSSLMGTYATKLDGYMKKQETYQQQVGDQLTQIINKKGGGVTKEELQELMKDVPEAYQKVVGLLEDLKLNTSDAVTNVTLNQALDSHKTNLTTTNGLIQNAINLLQAINDKPATEVTVNAEELSSQLGRILTQLTSGQTATSSQLDKLQKAIEDLAAAIKSQGGTAAVSSKEINALKEAVKEVKLNESVDNMMAWARLRGKESNDSMHNIQYKADTYYGAFRV